MSWLQTSACFFFVSLTLMVSRSFAGSRRSNILFILGDDLGWADFQRNDPEMRTPNLDRLATMGMFLDNAYVMETGVPTRVALMTGRYPHNFGLQRKNRIKTNRLAWLNETAVILPELLKGFNYSTHLVGQWNLGFCHWDLTPTGRGFDTHYGMLMGGRISYYNHLSSRKAQEDTYDFWDNREVDWSAKGEYSTDLFTARARQIIQNASEDQPWFIFLTYQAAHDPYEVPEDYVTKYCAHVTDRNRQIHCAMVAAMDEGIGLIMHDLEEKGVMDNTMILFMSDNGGPVKGGYSSNYPLRGGKQSLWEGGVKSYTVLKFPGMQQTDVTYSGLFHAVDVLPTIGKAAGRGKYRKPGFIDGKNMYGRLKRYKNSVRKYMLYNVNEKKLYSAIRKDNWKLIMGRPGKQHGWYPSEGQIEEGAKYEHIAKTEIDETDWHLFDLDQDPFETNNLYDEMNTTSAVLVQKLKNKLQTYWDQMLPGLQGRKSKLATQLRAEKGHWTPGWCDP